MRVNPEDIAQLQEIVAGRYDPRLRTVSHVIRDAIHLWLESFHTHYTVSPALSSAWDRIQRQRELEDEANQAEFNRSYLSTLEREFHNAQADRDQARLSRIKRNAWLEYDSTTSDTMRRDIERIIGSRED